MTDIYLKPIEFQIQNFDMRDHPVRTPPAGRTPVKNIVFHTNHLKWNKERQAQARELSVAKMRGLSWLGGVLYLPLFLLQPPPYTNEMATIHFKATIFESKYLHENLLIENVQFCFVNKIAKYVFSCGADKLTNDWVKRFICESITENTKDAQIVNLDVWVS